MDHLTFIDLLGEACGSLVDECSAIFTSELCLCRLINGNGVQKKSYAVLKGEITQSNKGTACYDCCASDSTHLKMLNVRCKHLTWMYV